MVRSVPRFTSAFMVVTVTVGLMSLLVCRSEAATPTPGAIDAPAVGKPATGMIEPGQQGSAIFTAPVSEFPGALGSAAAISYRPYTDLGSFSSGFTLAAADSQFSGIQVSGMGKVVGVHDIAMLNLGVESSRDTVEGARADAAAAMDKMIAVLRNRGVAERDIQTRYFNIYPRYDQQFGRDIVGYTVSNQVSAKIRNLTTVGSLIDETTKAGGNLTRFQGISFTIENTKPLEERARAAAAADLMAKANQMATLTGVQLGRPTAIIEGFGATPVPEPYYEKAMAMSSDAITPVLAGEMEVVITLRAVFAIQ